MPEPSPTPDSSFEAQYQRILGVAECRTQVQLAEVLDVRQSSISDAKRRQSIPSDWLMKLFEKKRINPEWIRLGVGAKHLNTAEAAEAMPHVVKVIEVRPPKECTTDELFAEIMHRALKASR